MDKKLYMKPVLWVMQIRCNAGFLVAGSGKSVYDTKVSGSGQMSRRDNDWSDWDDEDD